MADDMRREETTRGQQDPTLTGNAEPRLRQLGRAGDYEVADGDPDIRGWRVFDADGNGVGTVHDLIADLNAMQVRYVDVELDRPGGEHDERQHVLVPIGAARLSADVDALTLRGIREAQLASYPPFDHEEVTREYERRVRAAMSGAAGIDSGSDEDFYRHEHFDTSPFWDARGQDRGTAVYGVREGHPPGSQAAPPSSRRR